MMTFDEAKAKFSTETMCRACRHVGKRKPYYVIRGPDMGKMQWACNECGYEENSGLAEVS